jgi:ankyrin repeat protein
MWAPLWRAACEGLPLPPEVHVHSRNLALALLRVAIWNDHRHTVAELLQKIQAGRCFGPGTSIADLANVVVGQDMRPLGYAAMHGSVQAAAALLDAKASVNGTELTKAKPLYLAASHGHPSMVSLLTDANADVDEGVDGRTLTGYAARAGDCTATMHLLAAKAQPDTPEESVTPLCVAAQQGFVKIAQALIGAKADVERCGTVSSWTPLMSASCRGRVAVTEALIDAEADVNRVNGMHRTALSYAAAHGWTAVVALLVGAKADVNDTRSGQPPLVGAATHGHRRAVSELLQGKADVHQPDTYGWTAHRYAVGKRHMDVAALLVEAKAGLDVRMPDAQLE